jgi:hypothetical protein
MARLSWMASLEAGRWLLAGARGAGGDYMFRSRLYDITVFAYFTLGCCKATLDLVSVIIYDMINEVGPVDSEYPAEYLILN